MQTHSPDDYQAINRCLAMFDIFAMYVDQKFVDEKLVLKEWGHTFAYTWQHAEPCIEARNEREHYRSWANLREFGPRTVEWADANPRT
ncbi:MAG: hypothetical protein JWM49_518 [Microbacteriaceae bacterium]|nr:hypothetical protein [Microbacteriaceae bacterium]